MAPFCCVRKLLSKDELGRFAAKKQDVGKQPCPLSSNKQQSTSPMKSFWSLFKSCNLQIHKSATRSARSRSPRKTSTLYLFAVSKRCLLERFATTGFDELPEYFVLCKNQPCFLARVSQPPSLALAIHFNKTNGLPRVRFWCVKQADNLNFEVVIRRLII